jgi:ATP-dependent RNA helicase DeaD
MVAVESIMNDEMNETIVEPADALPTVTMADLPERLQQGAARAGWTELTPVQAKAMPYLMAGRDMMIQSRTGSGKTGAFVMPIIERVNLRQNAVQALVLVPTRELAQQVTAEAELLGSESGLKVAAVYGGSAYGPQLAAFRQGVHLVVGTPGRVLDHLLKRNLTLQHLRLLIFDEADRMMSMGFYPDMRQIQSYLPDSSINSYMFSATFPPHVLNLANRFLRQPGFLSLSHDNVHVAETEHVYYSVPVMDKDRALVRIIEVENPTSAFVFCNTRAKVHYVTVVLQRFGYDADELSSDLAQKERDRVLDRVRQGKLRFLVATDVAARGIDIPELSHVIQYEVPEDIEGYVHRAGRTGRAGASGEALSLVGDFAERMRLKNIARKYNIALEERPLPSDEDVVRIVSERMTVLLEARLRERDRLQTERMQRFLPLTRELGQDEEGQALLAMLLDDLYQTSLHAPPAVLEEEAGGGRSSKPSSGGDKGRRGRGRGGQRRRNSG